MRNGLIVTAALALGLLIPRPLRAHHGNAAFDTGKKVTLKGVVREWIYSNPHCLVKFDVTGEDGQVVQWIAEAQAPNVIFPLGYRRDSFKAGDEVTLTLEPVKDGRRLGRIIRAVLANGKELGPSASSLIEAAGKPQP